MKTSATERLGTSTESSHARVFVCAAISLLLAATGLSGCGATPAARGGTNPAPVPAPARAVAAAFTGTFTAKVRPTAAGAVSLQEAPVSIYSQGPVRSLVVLSEDGSSLGTFSAQPGESLLDFAVHPSGDISAVLATARTLRLVRLDSHGVLRFSTQLLDPEASRDPEVDLAQSPHDDTSMVPFIMRDAARVAPVGEDLVVAARTGRNTVLAYRFHVANDHFERRWRMLVEPGMPILARLLVTGSYDVMGQLENHLRLGLDADSEGNIAVAVTSTANADSFFAHQRYFHEPLPQHSSDSEVNNGLLITRIAADGTRLGTTAVSTDQVSELHGLRLLGISIAAMGRVRTIRNFDGTGWNAYDLIVDRTTGVLENYNVIDIDRGDVLFDMASAPGGYLAGGTTGYSQNPNGASITEDAQSLLLLLDETGKVVRRVTAPSGARHNGIRSVANEGTGWLIGGMQNGPGTHSHDVAPAAITSDGYVRTVKAE